MIYNLLAWTAWILSLPFIFVLSFKSKYTKSLPARFFLYKNPKFQKSDIHFHACSLGEVNAISNLVRKFGSVALTTTTATGFNAAQKITPNSRFLPFENLLPFWLEKSKVCVIFEAELWLNLVRKAKKNGSYVVLLNARISDKSYKSYLRFKFYYKMIFANIDLVLAQSEKDAERLSELGAKNIQICGNIKSANLPLPTKNYARFDKKLITIASTHEGEEELILANLTPICGYKYILAPRHPERFMKVAEICKNWAKKHNLSFEKFSQNLGLKSDFILLDTIGELINFYAISDVVVLGGSFISGIGGHNPIEVANFGVPIISGEYFHNQKALYNLVENLQICKADEIMENLKEPKATKITQICDLEKIINLLKEKI